ncbi:unnamed protein product [Rotaria sordida]|uniref:RING-type E3 ubiquitin transferase n=1 Tax=Rotaria sordida TaxID=392033 RepID=A0A813Y3Q1_9BILA|nr:unnamed protein product [Rotaria sordida]
MTDGCEFEFMEYMDEQSIDRNLICSICHKPLKDPVCTPCDHTYGRACITQWLHQSNNCSCPVCVKKPLSINELTQASRPLRNILDQLRVQCILCAQTDLQRGNFVDHINKVCPKSVVQCKAADIKCPWEGPRNELQNHITTCIFEPLRPVLASLIAESRQLIDHVQQHDKEIKELTQKMYQLQKPATNEPNDESDASSVSDSPVDDTNHNAEDAIFIRNLPAIVKFNDIFDLFSKVGRIKYNPNNHKTEIFIFKYPEKKNGWCNAKVTYVNKESAAAAVAEYNGKHIPQWNTRLQVNIFHSKGKNLNASGIDSNQGNIHDCQEAKAMENRKEFSNKDEKVSPIVYQPEPQPEDSQATAKNKKRSRPRYAPHIDKPTS